MQQEGQLSFDLKMVNTALPLEEFDFSRANQGYCPPQRFEDGCTEEQSHCLPAEGTVAFEDLESNYEQPCFFEFSPVSQMGLNRASGGDHPFGKPKTTESYLEKSFMSQLCGLVAPKDRALHISSRSSELLNKHRPSYNNHLKEVVEESSTKERDHPVEETRGLSAEEVMRVAAASFIESSAHIQGDPPASFVQPFVLSFSGLTEEEVKNVDLASLLLSVAEKVRNQQYDRATTLLRQCFDLCSRSGNPVQRVVFHFSEALQDRINGETGKMSPKRTRERDIAVQAVVKAMLNAHPVQLVIQKKLPYLQLMQFTSVQTIIDNVASANRIHLIDLSIRHGLQWTILLQSLAERSASPIDYLKISAVGTSEEAIAETGKRLVSFAKTVGIPLYFKAVIVSDLKDLKVDMFDVEEGEVVAAYSFMDVNPMIVRPESLDNLMRVIRKLKPCVMAVVDIEAKHNSPSFIKRFTEALFFYSSFFDCLDSFMDRDDSIRLLLEGSFHSRGIKNIVATEGSERVVRHVGINTWRTYFARFGLEESELNEWSSYQASLLVKQFARGSSCTLDKNGKSLIVGWKGTPLVFISAWKFQ